MGFIAHVYSLFRKLGDVNWASITSSAPYLRYDQTTDKIVGATVPMTASPLTLTTHGATETSLTLVGAAGQTAPFFSVKSPSGYPLLKITPDGGFNGCLSLGYDDNGNTGSAIQLYGTGFGVFGQIQCSGFVQSGSRFFMGGASVLEWNDNPYGDNNPYYAAKTRLKRQADGILRVENINGSSPVDGGVVQNGVYVDVANATSVSGQGSVVRKIAALGSDGTLHGHIPVFQTSSGGNTDFSPASPLTLTAPTPTTVPLTLTMAAGQTVSPFVIKNSAGAVAAQIDQYGQLQCGAVFCGVVGTNVIATNNQAAHLDGNGISLAGTIFLDWTDNNLRYGGVKTRVSRVSDGILTIEKIATDNTATAGGIVQQGVFVNAANTPAATTAGNITRKIAAYDATGNLLGYVAVYDSIT